MPSFLFAFVSVLLVSTGSRDQLLLAGLSETSGRARGLLVLGWVTAGLSALAMAWGGTLVANALPASGKSMLVALALLLAAFELAWPNRERLPTEPTRSHFAIFAVLLARQLGDGARFTVFAFAAATGAPWLAAAGGALAGGSAATLGWLGGAQLARRLPLRAIRRSLAALLLLAAIVIGLSARGIVH